jgi:hypothetical protein
VLVNEHCHCIHEMLKELNSWIARADQLKSGLRIPEELPKDIFELRGDGLMKFGDTEEDQIALSQMINQHINYAQVFQVVCCKLVPLLDVFKSPNLIWNMINYLSFILEKNIEQPDAIVECLKYLNILRILQNQKECHVDEAIIDMLKSLIA